MFPEENNFEFESPASEPTNPAPQPAGQVDNARLDEIMTNSIGGPLVIFFGPRDIGKTVTLWRLWTYIRGHYTIEPNQVFRKDDRYSDTITKFNHTLSDASKIAPDATGNINFLLLDVVDNNTRRTTCQILEAPGEHFFDYEKEFAPYPTYLENIFSASYRKVYLFFFAIGMFKNEDHMRKYCDRVVKLINSRLVSERDKIIIVCNKCDEQPWMSDGKPIWSEYKKNLIDTPPFEILKKTITNSRFGNVPFVPFMSGRFKGIENSDKKAVSPSPEYYPQVLWNEIYNALLGINPSQGCFTSILRMLGMK